jgi:nitrite reductase/ring-hydroxylating ferredoxin subunit
MLKLRDLWARMARGTVGFCGKAYHQERPTVRQLVMEASADVVRLGSLTETFGVASRAVLRVERDGHVVAELLLLRRGMHVAALVNRCPHLGRRLDDGRLRGGVLVCNGHGGCFELRTGRAVGHTALRLGLSAPARVLTTRYDGSSLAIDIAGLSP